MWARQLADGGRAVALLNRGATETKISVSWSDIGYPDYLPAAVRDLWASEGLGEEYRQLFRDGCQSRCRDGHCQAIKTTVIVKKADLYAVRTQRHKCPI